CLGQDAPRSSTGGLGVGAMRARWVPQRFSASRQPPDPGSVHTRKTRNQQILIIMPIGLLQAIKYEP
ncbi:hypothetical protein, partial [Chamaesiphon sp. OTE_75_metabat_556]|uniref:hypothetical protein n=1 Tax=Chamaesiphon sp. OTE_75_metabat_556 TaxID=2964692 RepID=UPI00286CFC71